MAAAQKQNKYTIETRRALHRIPELGWEETKTLDLIQSEIDHLLPLIPFEATKTLHKGGISLDIDVDPSFDRILLRADIDALPIEEKTGLSFSSKHPGIMHACGHDCHAAMLLGALRSLATGTIPTSNLRFVWQRAEEIYLCQSGGSSLVENGITDGVARVHGLHISSPLESGVLYSRPSLMMANATHITMEIKCTGGHVMHPNMGSNAIDISTDIHLAARNFCARMLDPENQVAFSPSISQAGVKANIMPEFVTMSYSLRNFLDPESLHRFFVDFRHHIESILAAYKDASLSAYRVSTGFPALSNDETLYEKTKQDLTTAGLRVDFCPLLFCGEDFSYYAEKKPGSFYMLGARQGEGFDHHTAYFNPDEKAFVKGVAYWIAIATA